MGDLLFITGGARSGKSAFAERQARRIASAAGVPVVYLATMQPGDEELVRRVQLHRAQRPPDWTTVEAPLAITEALRQAPAEACVLLDCLSLWATNHLLQLDDEDPPPDSVEALEASMDTEIDALLEITGRRTGALIVVTNEVGSGLVPPYPLGRIYRDLLGRANQRVSRAADRAWLLVAGRALPLPAAEK